MKTADWCLPTFYMDQTIRIPLRETHSLTYLWQNASQMNVFLPILSPVIFHSSQSTQNSQGIQRLWFSFWCAISTKFSLIWIALAWREIGGRIFLLTPDRVIRIGKRRWWELSIKQSSQIQRELHPFGWNLRPVVLNYPMISHGTAWSRGIILMNGLYDSWMTNDSASLTEPWQEIFVSSFCQNHNLESQVSKKILSTNSSHAHDFTRRSKFMGTVSWKRNCRN
jgi:hypothetical protein